MHKRNRGTLNSQYMSAKSHHRLLISYASAIHYNKRLKLKSKGDSDNKNAYVERDSGVIHRGLDSSEKSPIVNSQFVLYTYLRFV